MAPESKREIKQARRLLRELAPRARAEAAKNLVGRLAGMQPQSAIGASSLGQLREDNLEGLAIYQEPAGWYADILLRSTPIGVPNALGTPVAHPLPSRKSAEKAGYTMLVGIYEVILERERAGRDTPEAGDQRIFELPGMSISLAGEAVDTIFALSLSMPGPAQETLAKAESKLDESVRAISPDGWLTPELWQGATEQQRVRVATAAAMLMLKGTFRWPPVPQPNVS